MLPPANRLTLIDAMRPPPAHSFDAAMAVTFTLDLRALLAAPAAFALTRSPDVTAEDPTSEPIELLHAVRSHATNITVFSQAGEIALPPSRKVFAFLEDSVVPVTAPRHGVVHPKVWVLRYRADDSDNTTLRVLVASRNLTFDTSWDTILRLDQAERGPRCDLGAVADLFTKLKQRAAHLATDHADRVESLIAELGGAAFALPPGVEQARVHVLGFGNPSSPLPATARRSLVLTPFVTDDFFTKVRPERVDELVSRDESLTALSRASLDQIGQALVFDDGDAPIEAVHDDEGLSAEDPSRDLRGLHAKVFAFELNDRAHVFCGSANATGAAFSSNVELLVELIGPISTLGIDRLCEGSGDSGEQGLRQLFTPFMPASLESADEDPTAMGSLDAMRRSIGSLTFTGAVEPTGDGWSVTYQTREPIDARGDTVVRCWPLASPGNHHVVSGGGPLSARFETTLESLSAFLAFEVSSDTSDEVTQFVVPVPLEGVPEERERRLMHLLIGNAERFFRYLLALLEEDNEAMQLLDAVERTEPMDDGPHDAGSFHLPVLEKLVRTLQRDPAKILSLHPLVTDLAEEDALPPDFAGLWSTIYTVASA